jgi:hypothetical protein
VIGWVDNADYNDLGHDISVRIHGGRATEVHLWIPIMLFVFGAVMTGFAVWAVVKIPSRLASAPGTA